MNIHRLKMLANAGAINCADEPTAPEGGSAAEPQAGEAGEQEGEESPKATHPWDDPVTAEAEIKRLRAESGGYRTQKNELAKQNEELTNQLKGAKSQEDIDAAIADWQQKTAKLERENLVLQHGASLPETLRKYVQGDTEDEIKASVAELAATVAPEKPTPPARVGGGLNPGEEAPVKDPAKLAAQVRASSRFPRI